MTDKLALDCPSAPHQHPEAKLFGVVLEEEGQPRVAYLDKQARQPDRLDVEALGVDPGHALRFSAPCANSGCGQWRDGGCGLGKEIVKRLAPVVDVAPACTLRATCRWFAENGTASCLRCPQITTKRRADEAVLPPPRMPRTPFGPHRPHAIPSPASDPDGGARVHA
ncbi:hypothetical protein VCJ71_08280 [Alteriqipengyuania sp. WL0013]|uniref:hypothetical protein n=1 Tax=Alteriqipengyuania sp. WL0013 TaxID=3110773 RepID=UPI002CB4CDF5|nr:hypothetical protein [Alteriqipengyuania sp. WL0013]MEB3416059.1 hypothetical protein [Alteriqipengyuania sp. WL0013]